MILFELLTGQHPCDLRAKRTEAAARRAILAGPKFSLAKLCPDLPRVQELSTILGRALATDPTARFRNPAELAQALAQWLPPATRRPSAQPAAKSPAPKARRPAKKKSGDVTMNVGKVTGQVIGNQFIKGNQTTTFGR